jgi:hypothetical protein
MSCLPVWWNDRCVEQRAEREYGPISPRRPASREVKAIARAGPFLIFKFSAFMPSPQLTLNQKTSPLGLPITRHLLLSDTFLTGTACPRPRTAPRIFLFECLGSESGLLRTELREKLAEEFWRVYGVYTPCSRERGGDTKKP